MGTIFEVTDPNADGLLTLEEAQAALGLTDDSRDADLTRMIARISASIYRACNVRTDGINPPTLLSEGMTETFRLHCAKEGALMLSRRRVTEVVVITEGSTELDDETEFEIDRASGQLFRLGTGGMDERTCWSAGKVIVEYIAGFEIVPDDLKIAAETWLRILWRDAYENPSTVVDPALKVDDIPGVRRIERFVSTNTTSNPTVLPPEVEAMLLAGGYIELWVGW